MLGSTGQKCGWQHWLPRATINLLSLAFIVPGNAPNLSAALSAATLNSEFPFESVCVCVESMLIKRHK